MSGEDQSLALRRFGLGARPGDLKRVASDPRGYVLESLAAKQGALLDGHELPPSWEVFAEAQELARKQKADRMAAAAALAKAPAPLAAPHAPPATAPRPAGIAPPGTSGVAANTPRTAMPSNDMMMAPAGGPMQQASGQPMPSVGAAKPPPGVLTAARVRRDALADELAARVQRALVTDEPFVERLVMFWSNHFCVNASKGAVRGLAGGYEREAIRPHVLGKFSAMLRAVEQHPAMLIYLDNQQSTGPNSRAGRNKSKGLNENLAREILELHTLGVGGGYTQTDVTNFAHVLTGWTVGGVDNPRALPGRFFFAPPRHEPGAWTILGKRYEDEGHLTGERVLDDLARHPATARHIATKLAQHFVSDVPPPALVAALEKTFRDTEGDLAALARALAKAPEAWSTAPVKIAPPYDFLISVMRGLAVEAKPADVIRLSNLLGQPPWQPPSPKGWPDGNNAWMAPSEIRERLRVAEQAVRIAAKDIDPRAAANDLLGPAMSEATKSAVQRAESREQALVLLVMSSEFIRR